MCEKRRIELNGKAWPKCLIHEHEKVDDVGKARTWKLADSTVLRDKR